MRRAAEIAAPAQRSAWHRCLFVARFCPPLLTVRVRFTRAYQGDSMASKKQQPQPKKATVSAKKAVSKASAKTPAKPPAAEPKGRLKKTVAAVAAGAAATVEILIKAHDVKEAYEWLRPILDRVLSLSVRQADGWAVEMNACANPSKHVNLLKLQIARTALFVAVIDRLMSTTTKKLSEQGALTASQEDTFSSALLNGLERLKLDSPAPEMAEAIVSQAEMSALLKIKKTPRRLADR
jgi:hypothetical protein